MNNETIKMIENQICYRFKNPDLLQQAFIRRSYSKENGGENNEVLEFIGDKVLDFIVVKLLAEKFGWMAEDYEDFNSQEDWNEFISEYNESKLTNIKKKLVCKEMLAKRMRMLALQHYLIMGKSDIKQEVQHQDSVQEDLFEAIIGAVTVDSKWNIEELTNVVELMLDPNYYLENGFSDEENYVEIIQQWYQKEYRAIPVYEFSIYRGEFSTFRGWKPDSNYNCRLNLAGVGWFDGCGKTKSEARMDAAEKAYEYLDEHNLLYSMEDEVGEPEIDRAINQLQELYQKGHIGEPWYDFKETYDKNGNPIWHCECHIAGRSKYWYGEHSSKKQGKKSVAYDMLCDILNSEE